MQSATRLLFAPILTAACLAFMPSASAQDQSTSPPAAAPPSSSQSANIPDQKLDAAANAVKGVSAVKQDYEQKLTTASQTEKERLVGEARTAMEKAVTDQGITVAEYTAILQVAQNDPIIHQKIVQRLK